MPFRCLQTGDPEWQRIVGGSWRHDFYHLDGYHRLAERDGEHRARMLVWEEGEAHLALPLLLRPVPGAAGRFDATSVYGYAGPLASSSDPPAGLVERFREAVAAYLAGEGVVSLFSRLHPLIPQHRLLAGLGQCPVAGVTVSIDLDRSDEERRRAYRSNHRRDIRRLERREVRCVHDPDWARFDAFRRLYRQTMTRVGAGEQYAFRAADLVALRDVEGGSAELFACVDGDEVVCAGIALRCGDTLGYHLSGTAERFVGQAPLKLLLDTIASWGSARGVRRLHLGGGVGGGRDGLLHFKRGFSDHQHEFRVWRWVVDEAEYERLRRERKAAGDESFFPAYRAPVRGGA